MNEKLRDTEVLYRVVGIKDKPKIFLQKGKSVNMT